jgi:hypothetical protein
MKEVEMTRDRRRTLAKLRKEMLEQGIRFRTVHVVIKESEIEGLSDEEREAMKVWEQKMEEQGDGNFIGMSIGEVIIAYKTTVDHTNRKWYRLALSFCSPEDDFNKTYGEVRAGGRLLVAARYRAKSILVPYVHGESVLKHAIPYILETAKNKKIRWLSGLNENNFR